MTKGNEKIKNVLVISQYSAPHAGNYIASLLDLRDYAVNCGIKTFFAFPLDAKNKDWANRFDSSEVAYIENPGLGKFRKNPNTPKEIQALVTRWNIDLIHTNFDGYDIAASKVCRKNKIPCVCFFRDPIVKLKNPLKSLYQNYGLQKHYRWHLRDAHVVFVTSQFENLKSRLGIRKSSVIMNGLSMKSVTVDKSWPSCVDWNNIKLFTVGGGRVFVKGIDTLVDYVSANSDLKISVNVVGGGEVSDFINQTKNKRMAIIPTAPNINPALQSNDVFVSLSRYETFQNVIAEALYAGLPVIKSDCEGTNWANDLPGVQVVRSAEEFAAAVHNLKNISADEMKHAKAAVAEKHGNDTWRKKVTDLYKEQMKKL